MSYRRASLAPLLLLPFLLPAVTRSQLAPAPPKSGPPEHILPIGTVLPVQIPGHVPLRVGQTIRADLIYPVYDSDTVVLPAQTTLVGSVTELRSNGPRRIRARLGGDFTPYRIPVVRFTQIVLADGTAIPLKTETATDGAPLFRLVAPPHGKGGIIRQQWDIWVQMVRDQAAVFTGPDKGDRFVQFLYHQLPYHPQRIEKCTAWTVETAEPLTVATLPEQPALSAPVIAPGSVPDAPPTWIINAYLGEQLSSATSKTGQQIKATVAEPLYNADKTLAVPEGATLIGAITQAKPARLFGRAGKLRFDFSQLVLPDGQTKNVQAALTGVDSNSGQALAMTSEGEVKPKPQDKFVMPLLLTALALFSLDDDGGAAQYGKDVAGANGLGFVGRIVALAGTSPKVAAGIGFYGAAIATYDRWLARGRQVTFARDTRLVLQTTARRASRLSPSIIPSAPR